MGRLKKYLPQFLLVLLIWLVYGGTLSHQYAADDAIVITQNDRVQAGWGKFPELFKNIRSDEVQHRYGYRPITLLTFATEVQFFGVDPFWGHFFNLVYYSLLCLLILYGLKEFLPDKNPWWIWACVLLFAAHPLHTEVVANIKSRDEILSMMFGMLYLIWFWRWLKTRDNKTLVAAFAFAAIGFLSRENAVGYVLVGMALPLLRAEGYRGINIKRIVTPLAAIGMLGLIYFTYQFFLDENSFELFEQGAFHDDRFVANPLVDEGIGLRILNAFMLIGLCLKLFFVPNPLLHDYGFQTLEIVRSVVDWHWVVPLFLVIGLFVIGWRWRTSKPVFLFGLLFFCFSLAIYLHVPLTGPDMFAERFMFGPLLGLSISMMAVLQLIPKSGGKYVMIALSLACIYPSWQRAKAWENTDTLFEADKPYLEDCARFQFNYANMLRARYYSLSPAEQAGTQPQILEHYQRTLKITDRLLLAYLDLGSAYMEFNMPEQALPVFLECAKRYDHLAVPYFQLGKYHISQEEYVPAIEALSAAIERGRANSNYYYLKAVAYIKVGELESAKKTLYAGERYASGHTDYQQLMQKLNI